MVKLIKNLVATVVVAILIGLLFGLAKLLSMIPFKILIQFLKNNWGGILIGIGLSHLAMGAISLFGRRKRRRREEDDDE